MRVREQRMPLDPKLEVRRESKELRKLREESTTQQQNLRTAQARIAEEESKRKKAEALAAEEEARRRKLEIQLAEARRTTGADSSYVSHVAGSGLGRGGRRGRTDHTVGNSRRRRAGGHFVPHAWLACGSLDGAAETLPATTCAAARRCRGPCPRDVRVRAPPAPLAVGGGPADARAPYWCGSRCPRRLCNATRPPQRPLRAHHRSGTTRQALVAALGPLFGERRGSGCRG